MRTDLRRVTIRLGWCPGVEWPPISVVWRSALADPAGTTITFWK